MRSGTVTRVSRIGCVLVMTVLMMTVLASPLIAADTVHLLESAPAPVDNPLKGLVPYSGAVRGSFPHALEFNTLPYSALVKGYDDFDWQPLETLLDDIASRGHQAVLRIYLEYPGRTGVIPEFLIKDGLKIHAYLNTNTDPFPPALVETPDYEDQNLRRSLQSFIHAFGRKYDGDPRLGFVTAGLLGTWGEWHTYPRSELFASKAVQIEVMEAYEAAFKLTPVLLRYPAGDDTFQKAKNADRPFGYHDDSFAWATARRSRDPGHPCLCGGDACFVAARQRHVRSAAGRRPGGTSGSARPRDGIRLPLPESDHRRGGRRNGRRPAGDRQPGSGSVLFRLEGGVGPPV